MGPDKITGALRPYSSAFAHTPGYAGEEPEGKRMSVYHAGEMESKGMPVHNLCSTDFPLVISLAYVAIKQIECPIYDCFDGTKRKYLFGKLWAYPKDEKGLAECHGCVDGKLSGGVVKKLLEASSIVAGFAGGSATAF